jgi:hypothetical protein
VLVLVNISVYAFICAHGFISLLLLLIVHVCVFFFLLVLALQLASGLLRLHLNKYELN